MSTTTTTTTAEQSLTYATATPSVPEEVLRQYAEKVFREETANRRRRQMDVAYWAPPDVNINRKPGQPKIRPNTIHLGEYGEARPKWDDPAFDLNEKQRVERQIARIEAEGGTVSEAQMLEFDLARYVGDFWKNAAHNFIADMEDMSPQKVAAGGIITSDENAAVNVINVMQEMIGVDRREYTLLSNAVRVIATPNLTLSVDIFQGFAAYPGVPEGVEVDQQKGRITRQNFLLQKDVSSFGITDEARMISDRPLWDIHLDHSVRAMSNLKNTRIQVAIESSAVATVPAGTAWDVLVGGTGPVNTTNPLKQIRTQADAIRANQGRANTIVSGSAALDAFLGNSYVNGTQGGVGVTTREFGPYVYQNIPGLPGFTWVVDPLMTSNRVTVYDKDSLLLLQGPVRTAQMRKEGAGIDAYFSRDWHSVGILDASHFKAITTVYT